MTKKNVAIDINNNKIYLFFKRLLDILGSIFALIIFSPVFLIVSILIKLDSPEGSIIFAQDRNGLNGEVFKMYKFRSMVPNAEELLEDLKHKNEMDGPVFKIKDDPRLTKVGKVIRKFSIDEFPQFVNVLKGDMSLVGPRPPIPREVESYSAYEMQRLYVKPGLTCYWQIGGRNSIGFDEWMELDLKYISERSMLVDIKIILSTIKKLFGDKNAS
ncbi:MAG: sugar transferase [Intestinibacter sp.]|nr:sugar transferase [Intestinibacter sp.]MDY2738049.1 sugar transferase [Intestinibacter sp.]MDY4574243.1 sugar transferase [Intestinibacter sp.]